MKGLTVDKFSQEVTPSAAFPSPFFMFHVSHRFHTFAEPSLRPLQNIDKTTKELLEERDAVSDQRACTRDMLSIGLRD